MRVKDNILKQGYFWLPSNPDHKVPGTLTIVDGGDVEIELIGLFRKKKHQVIGTSTDSKYDFERIVGHVEKYGFVTLDECFYKMQNISSGGISKSIIFANRAYLGIMYDDNEIVAFNQFLFSVEGIDEWVGITGLEVDEDNNCHTTTIKYAPPEEITISLSNGMILVITYTWTNPRIPILNEAKITQKTYFKLVSETKLSVKEFASVAYKIVTLMCFSMDKTVCIEEVSSIEQVEDPSSDEIKSVTVSIYYPSHPYINKDNQPVRRLTLFKFEDIRNDAERKLNRWFDAYDELDPSMYLYFSSKTGGHKYIDSKFLVLINGLETYHRRTSSDKMMDENEYKNLKESIIEQCPQEHSEWLSGRLKYGNEISLRRRIDDVIKPFYRYFGGNKERKSFINSIVDTRNYLTHYDESLKFSRVSNDELWTICCKLEVIYQLHFLQLLGFTKEYIDIIFEKNLKQQIK